MSAHQRVALLGVLQLAQGGLAFALWRAPESAGGLLAVFAIMSGPLLGAAVAATR